MPRKERLDKILVSKGLVKSRELARAFIMEGKVFVEGKKIIKAGASVSETSDISLKETLPYVSRGGLKLEAAINFFNICLNNKIVMDIGSSTGGFTDCLLKMGAKKVYCIDVGYGQLAWSLRTDPRVVVMERTNMRYLDEIVRGAESSKFKGCEFEDLVKSNIDLATVDVSFISLTKVIPSVVGFLKEEGEVLALVKPQFEVGKGEVGDHGVVHDQELHLRVLAEIEAFARDRGLTVLGTCESPLIGPAGNREFFICLEKAKGAGGTG